MLALDPHDYLPASTFMGLEGSIKRRSHIADIATTRSKHVFTQEGEAGAELVSQNDDLQTRDKSPWDQYLIPPALDIADYMKKVRTTNKALGVGPQYFADAVPRSYGDGKFYSTVSNNHWKRTIDLLNRRQVPRFLTPAEMGRISFEPMVMRPERKNLSSLDVSIQAKMLMLVNMMVQRYNKNVESKHEHLIRKDKFMSMLRETRLLAPRGSTRDLAAMLLSEGEVIEHRQAVAIFNARAKSVSYSDMLYMDEVGFRKSVEDISAALNVQLPSAMPQVPNGGEWHLNCHIGKAANFERSGEAVGGGRAVDSPERRRRRFVEEAVALARNHESEISGEPLQVIPDEKNISMATHWTNQNSKWLWDAKSEHSETRCAGEEGDVQTYQHTDEFLPTNDRAPCVLLGDTDREDQTLESHDSNLATRTTSVGSSAASDTNSQSAAQECVEEPFARPKEVSSSSPARHGKDLIAQAIAASDTIGAQSREVGTGESSEIGESCRSGSNQFKGGTACKDVNGIQVANGGQRPGVHGGQDDGISVGTVRVIDFSSAIRAGPGKSALHGGRGETGQARDDVERKHSIGQEKSREADETGVEKHKWTSQFLQYHVPKTRNQPHTTSKNAVLHVSLCMLRYDG